MFDRLAKFDAAQAAYDWLWDRTGVYAGTVFFAAMLVEVSLRGLVVWRAAFLVVFGLMAGMMVLWQANRRYAAYNATADRARREWWWRAGVAPFAASSLLRLDPALLASDALVYCALLLVCVKIRARRPPERKAAAEKLIFEGV